MKLENVLNVSHRNEFRKWLSENHGSAKECWVFAKRGKTPPEDMLWYLDAVEEALCFGWIDSTVKTMDGASLQRFSPRKKGSQWTELNKERCRRMEKMGMMTDAGRAACPDLNEEFAIMPEIIEAFERHPKAWENFRHFPPLYQRIRIDNIQRKKHDARLYESRLLKLIEASEKRRMIGDWNDCGRLIEDS